MPPLGVADQLLDRNGGAGATTARRCFRIRPPRHVGHALRVTCDTPQREREAYPDQRGHDAPGDGGKWSNRAKPDPLHTRRAAARAAALLVSYAVLLHGHTGPGAL